MYIFTLKDSDFNVNFHLPCCVPPSSMGGFFFQKKLPKTELPRAAFSSGRFLVKIYGER